MTRLNVGGPAFQAIHLCRGLDDRGYRTLLVAGRPDGWEWDLTARARREGVAVARIPWLVRGISPARDVLAFLRILSLIRRWRPEVIHTHMTKAGLLGRLAGWLLRTPVMVHTYHGHVFTGYFSPGLSGWVVRLERFLAGLTDRLVAVGPTVKEQISGTFRIAPSEKVAVIPLGVPAPAPPGVRPGPPVIGFAGRLVPVKDPVLLVKAAAAIRRETPTIRLRIAGDGPLRGEVARVAREEGLSGRVEHLGWIDDMEGFYRGIHCLILSSRNEGTPRSILEAQAAGIPVVATDVGGVRDLFQHRRDEGELRICDEGIIVRERSPGALARAAVRILREPALGRRMGEAGRARAIREHSEDRLVSETERLYRGLLREKGLG